MQQQRTSHFYDDLVSLLIVVFKYKRMISIVAVTVAVVGVFMAWRIPTLYEAKATLLVKLGHELMYRPETQGGNQRVMSQEEALNNEIKILTNKDLIKHVVAAIGVGTLYPDLIEDGSPEQGRVLEIAAMNFEQNLSAVPVEKSNIIELSFKHEKPSIAAKATNALLESFRDKHIEVYSDPKSSFLEKQADTFSEKLKQVEDKLQAFKQQYQVYSLDEQRSALLQQRIGLDTALRTAQTQIREVEQKIAFVKGSRWSTEAIMETRTQLRSLQQKERDLLERYTENSRVVQSLRKEMQAVKESVAMPLEDARRIELSKWETELSGLRAKVEGLQRQVGQISGEVQVLDAREKEYLNLKRDLASQEANYKNYLAKFEESRIVDDMNRRKLSNVSVIQTATVPIKPAKSKKRQYALFSVILGVGAAIGLALIREHGPQRCSTPLSAEKQLGLPVIVSIALKK